MTVVCNFQTALKKMKESWWRIFLYFSTRKGPGIWLAKKNPGPFALQNAGLDTVDANHRLGFEADERVFSPAAAMLKALGVTTIKLMTNNPDKLAQLEKYGITIKQRGIVCLPANPHNHDYLETKKVRSGHLIGPD
ncbi:MAG: hypothetical protein CM15mP80_08670 [Alphaproteobacteria bacterium]|nr:MAG: hypothetical protein CM15mP80_08670 [Alphaproteobacteria bacterium]